MKTININLIGDLGKTSKTSLKNTKKGTSFDAKNQILAYILIVAVLIVFAASLGGWLLVKQMTSNLDRKLLKLNENLNTLREQETELSNFRKSLKKEKEITEFKIVIQKQLNSSFFPWSAVLKEIAAKIPKDIIVLKIEKTGNTAKSKQEAIKLKISGIIPANKKPAPLMMISLFIFNLNATQNSLLTNAKILKLDFNDKTKTYEFEIETSINNGVDIARKN